MNSAQNSNSSLSLEIPPLISIKKNNFRPNSNKSFELSIDNHYNNTNKNKNNTINNTNLSSESIPSTLNYSSGLTYYRKGRFTIVSDEHYKPLASIIPKNVHSINKCNKNDINSSNEKSDSSTSLKSNPLHRHLSLDDKASFHSNDRFIIKKNKPFKPSHQTLKSTTEEKQSRFIIIESNGKKKKENQRKKKKKRKIKIKIKKLIINIYKKIK